MVRLNIQKRAFTRGKKTSYAVRIPDELKEVLETLAEASGLKMPELIRAVLDQYAQQASKPKLKD